MTELTIGQKIKHFRIREGLSQQRLETSICASSGSISRIESDRVNPTKETLFAISSVLNLTKSETAYLFGIVEEWEILFSHNFTIIKGHVM